MEHARKFILLPRESLDKLEEMKNKIPCTNSVQTPGDELSRLDNKMSEILNSKNITDETEKWKIFEQTLQRFLRMMAHLRIPTESDQENPIIKIEAKNYLPDEAILESVPGKYTLKAKLLLRALHNTANSILTWDEKGVVTIHGSAIQGSNIIDLINEAMRPRKTFNPVGRTQFARLLREINIPRECIGNKDLLSAGLTVEKSLRIPKVTVSRGGRDSTDASPLPRTPISSGNESDAFVSGSSDNESTSLQWKTLKLNR